MKMKNLQLDFAAQQDDIRYFAIDIAKGVDEYMVVKELVSMFPKGTKMQEQAEEQLEQVQRWLNSTCYLYTAQVNSANKFYQKHKDLLPADWVPPKSAMDLVKQRIRLYITD